VRDQAPALFGTLEKSRPGKSMCYSVSDICEALSRRKQCAPVAKKKSGQG
jgi:hypothetical protein